MLVGGNGTTGDSGGPPIVRGETLDQRVKRMQKALVAGNEGPYLVAEELHGVAAQWECYKAEAGDLEFTSWCKQCFGNGRDADYWSKRWGAMLELGREIRRNVSHDVACWLVNLNLPADVRDKCRSELVARRMAHPSRQPLSMREAKNALRDIIGSLARTKVCASCAKLRERVALLEALLVEHGIGVPE